MDCFHSKIDYHRIFINKTKNKNIQGIYKMLKQLRLLRRESTLTSCSLTTSMSTCPNKCPCSHTQIHVKQKCPQT